MCTSTADCTDAIEGKFRASSRPSRNFTEQLLQSRYSIMFRECRDNEGRLLLLKKGEKHHSEYRESAILMILETEEGP